MRIDIVIKENRRFYLAGERRTFNSEFKLYMVRLYEIWKQRNEIVCEYDLTPSALGKWIKHHQNTG